MDDYKELWKDDFERWWNQEGSEMRPERQEYVEDYARRVAEIAWRNGSYCGNGS